MTLFLVFVVGMMLGGLLVAGLYEWLLMPRTPHWDRKPHDTERGRMFVSQDGNGYRED